MSYLFRKLRKSRIASATVAAILAFSVLLSTFSGLAIFAEEPAIDVWELADSATGVGVTVPPSKGGDGSAADKAIIIETPEEFAHVISTGGEGKFYTLAKDIYLNDPAKINWADGSKIDAEYVIRNWYVNKAFNGTIDGAGHTVYGMYVNTNSSNYTVDWSGAVGAALIPTVAGNGSVSLSNLKVDNAYINFSSNAAVIVATMPGASKALSVNRVAVGYNVYVTGANASVFMAVNLSSENTISITNSYSLGVITTKADGKTGFIGDTWIPATNITITNSYNAAGPISSYKALTLGNTNYSLAESSDKTDATALTVDKMKGANALTAADQMPNLGAEYVVVADGYPVHTPIITDDGLDIWEGPTKTTEPTKGGDGSSEDKAILIETPEELAYVVSTGGAGRYYKLSNDIYLNHPDKVNWADGTAVDGYVPNVWYNASTPAFSGTIDGAGHKVYGIYFNVGDTVWSNDGVGFISNAKNGAVTIQNLGIEKSYIKNNNYAGGFIGTANGNTSAVTVNRCYTGAEVTVSGYGGGAIVGNAVNAANVIVSNCYNLGITKGNGEGEIGLTATHWGSNFKVTITNSYNANGPITTRNVTDGTSACQNNYATADSAESAGATTITADNMKGADVLTNPDKMPNLGAEYVAVADGYPVHTPIITDDGLDIWEGPTKTTEPTKGGNGSSEDKAILIETPEELAYVVSTGGAGRYYKLSNDIYLNHPDKVNWADGTAVDGYVPNVWYNASTPAFSGTIDGAGHKVYGIYFNVGDTVWSNDGVGFISNAKNGAVTIQNLGIEKSYIKNNNYAGGFIGTANGNTSAVTVNRCYTGAEVTVSGYGGGAIVGNAVNAANVIVSNCYNLGTTKGNGEGEIGLTATHWGSNFKVTITNSYNANGPITTRNVTDGTSACQNNYATADSAESAGATTITADKMKGADVLTNPDKMPNLGAEYVAVADGYPVHTPLTGGTTPPADEDSIWGETRPTTEPAEGTGEESDPKIIKTAAEFAYIFANGGEGKYYKLEADIYLNDITKINWTDGTVADDYTVREWYQGKSFKGSIDGNGHTVYGLYINTKPTGYVWGEATHGAALVSVVNSGNVTIDNLAINNAYIHYSSFSAGFVGVVSEGSNVSINRSYLGDEVTVAGYNAAVAVSTNFGSANTIDIYNTYNLGNIVNKGGFTGFTGDTWNGNLSVKYCYNATGPIRSKGASGVHEYNYALAGSNDMVSSTLVSADNMKGEDVLTNQAKMPNLGEEYTEMGAGEYPTLWAFSGKDKPEDDIPLPTYEYWSASGAVSEPTVGSGTEDEPFIITSAEELAYVIKNGGGEGKYYKLANDIYLNDLGRVNWETGQVKSGYVVRQWFTAAATEDFKGTLDGNGYKVYGMYVDSSPNNYFVTYSVEAGAALIPTAADGAVTVKNIGIDNAYINYGSNAAGILGTAAGTTTSITIERTSIGKNVMIKGSNAGAIFSMTIHTGEQADAGIVAIKNCYNQGTVESKVGAGTGLFGETWIANPNFSIKNSYNATGPISSYKVGTCNNNYSLAGSYEVTNAEQVAAENMMGADVLENLAKMPKLGRHYVAVDNDYPVLTDIPPVENNVWDGSTRTEPKDADGDGVYEINNAEELAYIVYTGGDSKKYELTADIYLNDVARKDWQLYGASTWYSMSVYTDGARAFNGYLEGNGHTVYGLYYNDEIPTSYDGDWTETGQGLFPILSTEGVIRNVHIRNSIISAKGTVGAFAGKTGGPSGKVAEINGCSVDETVSIKGYVVGGFVGGGSDRGVNIFYSYMTASIANTGSDGRCNAFTGDIWSAQCQIVDCYYIADNPSRGSSETYIAVYGTGSKSDRNGLYIVNKSAMYGSKAKTSMKKLDWTVWYTVDGKTPQQKVVPEGQTPPAAGEGEPGRVWYGAIASSYAGGTGTKEDPYLISTPEQLARLVTTLGSVSEYHYYKITHDIKLNDTSKKNWTEDANEWFSGDRAPFKGHLDGAGHVISGLYIDNSDKEGGDYSGLFTYIMNDSSIKRLGITSSYINGGDGTFAMAAPFVAFVWHWQPSVNPDLKMPVISECFSDETVYVEGNEAGGIVAGAPSPIRLENCYSTADLFATSSKGRAGMVAGAWGNDGGPTLVNCYASTKLRDRLVGGNGGSANYFVTGQSFAENCYIDGPGAGRYIQSTIIKFMQGNTAKETFQGFDFNKIWKVVDGGTPVLRCFKNAEKYSSKKELQKVKITFVTNGGSECEPIYGYPRIDELSEDVLPTPKRYGYKFVGWYHFSQLDLPLSTDVFPDFDINLFAKWEPVGFNVTFENTPDPIYEYNQGVVQMKPGVKGYNPRYVHGGVKSMHTLPDSKVSPTFLLSYENTLEIGKEYEINFWVTTDTANQSGEVRLVHAMYGDINDVIVGDEVAFEYSGMVQGVWKKYTAKIVANAPYLLIKAPIGASLYFDDIQVVPTGEEGKLGQIDNYKPVGVLGGMNLTLILAIAGGVILLGGAAVVIAIVIKKRKAKAQ